MKPQAAPPIAFGAAFATLAVLCLSPLGAYVDQTLFLDPIANLRTRLGLAPALDPSLRVVVVDDRAVKRLGRLPHFGEWTEIARRFAELGFETALLLDSPDLDGLAAEPLRHPGLFFAAGALAGDDVRNARTVSGAILPSRLVAADDGRFAAAPRHPAVLAPAPRFWTVLDRIGEIGLGDDRRIWMGRRLEPGAALPHLAAWAKRDGDAPRVDQGWLRAPVHIEYPDGASVAAQSVPALAFFDPQSARIAPDAGALSPALKKRLSGGKTVLFVPQAFTGARFVRGPSGLVPSYVASIAVLNGVVTGRIVRDAPFSALTMLLLTATACLAIRKRGARWVAAFCAAAVCLIIGAGVFSYVHAGIAVPVAQAIILVLTCGATRQALVFLLTVDAKARLEKDVELGDAVQRTAMSSQREGEIAGYRFRIDYQPYGPMAGDWFQVHLAPDAIEPYGVFAVGDVVGKGPSAALSTAVIASVFRRHARAWQLAGRADLPAFVADLDVVIRETFRGEQNSTMSMALVRGSGISLFTFGSPRWMAASIPGAEVRLHRSPQGSPPGLGDLAPRIKALEIPALTTGEYLFAATDGYMDGPVRHRFEASFKAHAVALPEAARGDADGGFAAIVALLRDAADGHTLPDDRTVLTLVRCEAEAASAVPPSAVDPVA